MASRPKVGLVFGGGGAKGAAEVGVLKAIERSGIHIDYIAGTSVGAIIGGLYANGYSATDLDTLFRNQDWLNLLTDRDSTLAGRIYKEEDGVTYLFGFPVKKRKEDGQKRSHGFFRGDKIYDYLDSLITHSPAKVKGSKEIPFKCVAFDFKHRQEVVLDTGCLARNIRASMAIPGVFKPAQLDSMMLVDGGMINNLPIDIVRQMGADIVIAIDLQQKKHDDYKSPFSFLRSLGGIFEWLADRPDIKKYNLNRQNIDIYINPDLKGYSVSSFTPKAIAEMIKIGEEAGKVKEDDLKTLAKKLK